METIKLKIAEFLLKKYALGFLVKGWQGIKGYKTQIFMALSVCVWLGQTAGYIDKPLADQLYALFGGGAGFSFIQKLSRYEPIVKELTTEIKKESEIQ